MEEATRAAIAAFKGAAQKLYGPRLRRVVLFGSHARGEATPDSDIDLLVVLGGPVRPFTEIDRLADATYAIELEHRVLFGVLPVSEEEFASLDSPLFINVRREGIPA